MDVYVELKLLGLSGGRGLFGSKLGGSGDVGYGDSKLRIEGLVLLNVHKGILQY